MSGSRGSGADGSLLGLLHRLDRHVDLEVQRLADPRVDERARARRADHEAPDLLERVLRRRQADALRLALLERGEAFERQREVRAALRRRDGVDLVEDDRLDAREDLARAAGEHEVERLGRGDEDVRRVAAHRGAVALRRVAGAHADGQRRADPAQRRAQVAVDVVRERLQRRDVDEARVVRRLPSQPVEPPEERGERLARSRRRRDERVLARGDRRPCLRLDLGRALEGGGEPVADRGCELRQRHKRPG